MEQFIRLVRETPAGREVKITVVRNGAPVTLAARPESGSSRMQKSMTRIRELMPEMRGFTIETMPRPAMNWESTTLGIEAEGLSEQLASFFGVKHGVLVRSVSGSSLAEKSGIKAGDVITKVDGEEVKSPRDVTSQIRAARGKSSAVAFTLTRDRKEQTLKVTFPETSERPAAPPRVRSIRNKELNL
jgi:serine protease Do